MADNRNRWMKPAIAIVVVVCLFLAGLTQQSLNEKRTRMGLTRISEPLKNAPPLLAFSTVALGGFRGLIANSLWARLYDLQMEGKYFEFVQLSHWITQLQPTIPEVWIHLGWNLAYNISVKFDSGPEKWPWVRRGIELLRDGGLQYNPNSVDLYRELAWHFQHKLGMDLDAGNMYYKSIWANMFSEVLEGGTKPNFETLINPQTEEEMERARILREEFKMDPEVMKEVDEDYGPFEWRLPETHAIYWAVEGMKVVEKQYANDSKGFEQIKKDEFIKLRRVIYQSMQLAFRRGRLIPVPIGDKSEFDFGPNLDLVDNADKSFRDMIEAETDEWRDHIRTGHKNMIAEAAYYCYTHNRRDEAARWFQMLQTEFPSEVRAGQNLDEFCIAKVTQLLNETSRDRVRVLIDGILLTAYYNIAIGEDAQGINNLTIAEKAYVRFTKEMAVLDDENQNSRVMFPPFSVIKKDVLQTVLDPDTSPWHPQLRAFLRQELGLGVSEQKSETEASASQSGNESPGSNP